MDTYTQDLSIIIPVYNTEKYLPACIDSLMRQGDLRFEIILVNDGSTDRSGTIADEYARKDTCIRVIHQANGGASAARNTGLRAAQGKYIAFFDSDDWIKDDSLSVLYREADKHQADVVMGNIWLCRQDGSPDQPFKLIPADLTSNGLSGKEGFIRLVETHFYLPMPFKCIYRSKFLHRIQVLFEEGIMHEDELWMPVVLYQAEKMVISDIEFYYYRQNEESVMNSTHLFRRLDSLFRVTDRLMEWAGRFDFSGEGKELKSWWYVTVFRLYAYAFTLLSKVKDSSYSLPAHHLERFRQEKRLMIPAAQQICGVYFRKAETGLKKYTDWLTSSRVSSADNQNNSGEKQMLIYNTPPGKELVLKREDVPADWVITTDRKYFQQAYVVVFYLPDLQQELGHDLDKPEGQVWVSCYLESEKEHPLINDPEIRDMFDLFICYRPDETFTAGLHIIFGHFQ